MPSSAARSTCPKARRRTAGTSACSACCWAMPSGRRRGLGGGRAARRDRRARGRAAGPAGAAAVERSKRIGARCATPAAPATWGERLRALLDSTSSQPTRTRRRLHAEPARRRAAALAGSLRRGRVRRGAAAVGGARALAGAASTRRRSNQPFFAGAVTFATLMPMRAIPFRLVALLGMNDGDYPRSRDPMDFDLMGHDYRPGDRSRREDDRYLFLEALLSARERLHISWVGRSIRDNTERPPSVLVAQLRDHLAAGWTLAARDGAGAKAGAEPGKALLQALTAEHRAAAVPARPTSPPARASSRRLLQPCARMARRPAGQAAAKIADAPPAGPASRRPADAAPAGRLPQGPGEGASSASGSASTSRPTIRPATTRSPSTSTRWRTGSCRTS